MKKYLKIFIIISILACFSGCTKSEDNAVNTAVGKKADNEGSASEQKDITVNSEKQETSVDEIAETEKVMTLDKELFEGKIRDIFYGNGNKILVQSNKLYLYDTLEGIILAQENIDNYSENKLYRYDDGYVMIAKIGQSSENSSFVSGGDGECTCIIYDENLQKKNEIVLSDKIMDEVIINLTAVAVAKDASKIACATLGGIYIYDLAADSTDKIYQLNSENDAGSMRLCSVEYLTFAEHDTKLGFLGNSVPQDSQENSTSISTYGTINLNGSGFTNAGDSTYTADEMIAYDSFMYLPSSFKKAKGTLLKYSFENAAEEVLKFTDDTQGKDGVYGSDNGEYFSTAKLGNALNLYIYDKNNNLLKEQTIGGLDELYYYRIPKILLLDNSRTCIVIMGRNQSDIETEINIFSF